MRMCVLYLWRSLRHSLPSGSDNFPKIGSPILLISPAPTQEDTETEGVVKIYISQISLTNITKVGYGSRNE